MIVFLVILLVPAFVAFACFAWHLYSRSRSSLSATGLCSAIALLIWFCVFWWLRDGIALDDDPSSGLLAFQRFARLAWVPLVAWVVMSLVSVSVYIKCGRHRGAA